MIKKTKVVMLMCIAVFLAALVCAGAASAATVTANSEAELRTYLTTDNYVILGTDLTLTNDHIEINTTSATLDLDGHSLTAAPNQRIFYLNGTTVNFTLTDTSSGKTGRLVGNGAVSSYGGAVLIESSKFNMINCKIVDCAVTGGPSLYVYYSGGAVYLKTTGNFPYSPSTMTMINSQIDNCSSVGSAGGVFVDQKSSLVMTDSVISHCVAGSGGAIHSCGSITMNNCRINDCSATHSTGGSGGGVYFTMLSGSSSPTFLMNHSFIDNCTCAGDIDRASGGGGVYVNGCVYISGGGSYETNPQFTMDGGSSITNCRAGNGLGGGVLLADTCTFNLNNGSITGCSDKNGLNSIYNSRSKLIIGDANVNLDCVNLTHYMAGGGSSNEYGRIIIEHSIKSEFAGYVHNISVDTSGDYYLDKYKYVVENGMAVADPFGQFTLSPYTASQNKYLVPSLDNKSLRLSATPYYNVIVYTDGRGNASASPTLCPQSTDVTLTATPNSGFQFGYWEDTTTKVQLGTSNPFHITMPNYDLNVTAHFVGTQFNVTVRSAGNGTASSDKGQYEKNATVTLIPSPDLGYKFSKWESPNVTAFSGNTFIMPAEDVVVTAYFTKDTTGVGAGEYILTGLGEGAANVKVYYDEPRKTLFVENTSPAGSSAVSSLGDGVLTITQFGFSDSAVKMIEVDYDVNLDNASNAFKLFTNAGFNYLGDSLPSGFTIGGITPYTINATHSEVYIDALHNYTGEAITVDTNYAVPGQNVRIAVKPLQNYSVYGWTVIMSGDVRDDSGAIITRSLDPNDGATTYILTMPASDVIVIPKLRDQGSTFVTYIFLDADTYVMEIPADFSLTGINKTVEGKEVNITACDLLEGHNLKVTMNSTNGLYSSGLFQMLSVKDRNAIATYAIGEKDVYRGAPGYSDVTINGKTVLNTKEIPSTTSIEELIAEGNLKTDLQFTLKQIMKQEVIGKYKDKLTFTVEITTA